MDILAHGLWSSLVAKAANKALRQAQRVKIRRAVFWGVFPDIFTFALPFIVVFWYLATGQMHWADFPKPDTAGAAAPAHPIKILGFTHNPLYEISHSIIVFLIVFAVFSLIYKRPLLELLAWLLHILIDIPTHSYQFYPTPAFWPLWDWKFNGIVWANPYFLLANYAALLIVYLLIRKRKL